MAVKPLRSQSAALGGRAPNLKFSVATGAGANTNIAVANIRPEDIIISVVMFATGVPSDVTSTASIQAAGGNIRLTGSSSGNQLLVVWLDVSG